MQTCNFQANSSSFFSCAAFCLLSPGDPLCSKITVTQKFKKLSWKFASNLKVAISATRSLFGSSLVCIRLDRSVFLSKSSSLWFILMWFQRTKTIKSTCQAAFAVLLHLTLKASLIVSRPQYNIRGWHCYTFA